MGTLPPKCDSEVPDDWMFAISDKEMCEISRKILALALSIPSLKVRVMELVRLIYGEGKNGKG